MKAYIAALMSIGTSVYIVPWVDELVKVYIIAVVILVTVFVNLLFWFARAREFIINHFVAAIIQRVLSDHDIQKLIDWPRKREEIRANIQERMGKKGDDSAE
jgi:hypothetical protein